jgi:hypothetical protein
VALIKLDDPKNEAESQSAALSVALFGSHQCHVM